ncbi:hypothetical protein ACFWUP_06770 [Nocardia sp. NPDC058658]|uniref:hypothetical protein n=1 Tax=Nocardia sp. NPDC058658 TaxID=3346580 RepID=UPI003666EF55
MAPFGVWIAERRRRALREHWTRWQVQYWCGNNEYITLIDEQGQAVRTHKLNTWPAVRGQLFDESTTHVWFAGDPLRRGVLSRPGGADLRYCWASMPTTFEIRAHLAQEGAPQRRAMPDQHENPANVAGNDEHGLAPTESVAANGFTAKRVDGHLRMVPPPGSPTVELPPDFGGFDDTRYPTPRKLRRWLAYLTDVAIHLTLAAGIALAIETMTAPTRTGDLPPVDPRVAVATFLAVSFLDRVVLQTFSHTTIGKLMFDLVIVDRDTGRYPRFRWLLTVWVYGVFAWTLVTLECTERPERYFLPAVRRTDVEAGAPTDSPPTDTTASHSAPDSDRSNAAKVRDTVGDGIIAPSNGSSYQG